MAKAGRKGCSCPGFLRKNWLLLSTVAAVLMGEWWWWSGEVAGGKRGAGRERGATTPCPALPGTLRPCPSQGRRGARPGPAAERRATPARGAPRPRDRGGRCGAIRASFPPPPPPRRRCCGRLTVLTAGEAGRLPSPGSAQAG